MGLRKGDRVGQVLTGFEDDSVDITKSIEMIEKVFSYCKIDLSEESPFNTFGIVDSSTETGLRILQTPCTSVPNDLVMRQVLSEVLFMSLGDLPHMGSIHMVQLGFNLDAFVVRDAFDTVVMINPVVEFESVETYISIETCYSVGAGKERYSVKRPKSVNVVWKGLDNKDVRGVYYRPEGGVPIISSALISQCIDHSSGTLIFDRGNRYDSTGQ